MSLYCQHGPKDVSIYQVSTLYSSVDRKIYTGALITITYDIITNYYYT